MKKILMCNLDAAFLACVLLAMDVQIYDWRWWAIVFPMAMLREFSRKNEIRYYQNKS